MSISSVTAGGAGRGYLTRLRSINLRPVIQGSTTGSNNGSSTESSGSSHQEKTSPEPSNSKNHSGSTDRTGRESLSPSSVGPAGQFTVITGNRPGTVRPSGQGEQSSAPESGEPTGSSESGPKSPTELSSSERRKVQKLKRVDARVRSHEQAHLAAAGQYAQGGISFETVTGPDGNEYAVGGEVSLDTSSAKSPEETIQKMRQVKAAALAPANPSPQDQSIAANAAQELAEARRKQQTQDSNQNESLGESSNSTKSSESSGESSSGSGFERVEDFGASASTSSITGNRNDRSPATGPESTRNGVRSNRSSQINQFGANNPSASSRQPNGQVLNLLV